MSQVLFESAKADVSAEVDHFYVTDFTDEYEADVERIAAKLSYANIISQAILGKGKTMSTVHMLDGYHMEGHGQSRLRPVEVFNRMIAGAEMAGVSLDYIVEEGALVSLANKALGLIRLKAEPVNDGWEAKEWVRVETRAYNDADYPHTEYIYGNAPQGKMQSSMAMHSNENPEPEDWSWRMVHDIQIFNYKRRKGRIVFKEGMPEVDEWACPYLAAISTMARLGLMRVVPELLDKNNVPDHTRWSSYPLVTQLNPNAAPFQAHEIFNVLPMQYLDVESASRLLVGAVDLNAMERINYHFYPGS